MRQNVSLLTLSAPPRSLVRTRAPRGAAPPPVDLSRVPHAALAAALRLAGGDAGRLRFEPDGSVLVMNARRVRQRPVETARRAHA